MKAVLHFAASAGFRAQIAAARPADVDIVVVDAADDAGFAREMRDADVLLHALRPVRAADMEGAPGLRLIQKIGVGVNTIDLETAKRLNIAVCNMPGTNTQAVVEMTLMLMLAALRRAAHFDAETRAGRGWLATDALDHVGEVCGRTVGLVGYGAVAARLAPVLQALGADVRYTARSPKAEATGRYMPLGELLAVSDVVSLHCPATSETRGMLGAAAIGGMKRGAVLVNTARGELVDEMALTDALRKGHLAAAGLDVFVQEPVQPDNPLLRLPNVVVAPHIAWLTPETLGRSLGVAFENCRRLKAGEPLLHRVV
ncbi:MAG: 2-hydroxyacid dehydrogenase [Alphaproteobacteria bacterium]|nr:2-hydroxyacid dehydrogenase [Alphaproteobacteria bacterium]